MTTSSLNQIYIVVHLLLRLLWLHQVALADVTISVEGDTRTSRHQPVYIQRGDVIQLVCTSTSFSQASAATGNGGDDVILAWFHNDAPIDPSAVSLAPSYRRLRVRNARLTSRLTVTNASELDSGQYTCQRTRVQGHGHLMDSRNENEEQSVVVIVSGSRRLLSGQLLQPAPTLSPLTVSIVDPPDNELTVRHGQSFTLKCAVTGGQRRLITSRRRSVSDLQELLLNASRNGGSSRWIGHRQSTYSSPISSLHWLHNGIPLSDGSSSLTSSSTGNVSAVGRARSNVQTGGGTVCGRVVITEAIDVDTGWMTSLMTCRSAGSREAGVYKCRDSSGRASDDVTVNVDKQPGNGKHTVEIVQPTTQRHRVRPNTNVEIKCKADKSQSLVWYLNGTQQLVPEPRQGVFITSDIDSTQGWRISLLHLVSFSYARAGKYTCRSETDMTDNDSVVLLVGPEQTVKNSGDDDFAVPTMFTNKTMQIYSTLTLHCSFSAAAERGAGLPTELAAEGTSSREYYAEWTKDDWLLPQIGGVNGQKYSISQGDTMSTLSIPRTALPCPFLHAPPNGRLVSCPQPAVYGTSCTFHCDPGYRVNNRSTYVCERNPEDGQTFWTPIELACTPSAAQVPSTTSTVSLRVGFSLQLRCADSVMSWTKDGRLLNIDGRKYSIENNTLTIKNAERGDVGVYVCDIERDSTLIGRNKFNVITLPCPPLPVPPGVIVEHCPSKTAVYGETCSYSCVKGRTLITGNKLRSCEVTGFDTSYWTGEKPVCAVNPSTVVPSRQSKNGCSGNNARLATAFVCIAASICAFLQFTTLLRHVS